MTNQVYSNLTEAIEANRSIDWSRLDRKTARLTHTTMGTLTIRLKLEEDLDGNLPHPVDIPQAWHEESSELEDVIESAWFGNGGWTLYIQGEVPLTPGTENEQE